MKSIFDMFRTPADNNQQNQQNQQGSANNQQNQNNQQQKDDKNLGDSPDTKNKDGKMPGTAELPENPLDSYAKMFENAAKNTGVEAPKFQLDPETLSKVSSSMNFVQNVPKEVMEAATKGDVSALMQVINISNQNAYRAALEHGTSLTDTYIEKRSDYEGQRINSGVRAQLTQSNLADAPNYDHPVVKEELNRIATQFARANPDASPKAIADAAQKYIADLAGALNPKKGKGASEEDRKAGEMPSDFDWSAYLTNQPPKG